MSGHSKWATIKRKKEKTDSARGKVFSKLIKEITIATRMGGGDEGSNPRLRTAIATAKAANMPANNIERAVMKGTGELPGVSYEEVAYEAYGPGGTALLIEVLTDNRNRTVSEIRHMIGKHGGNLGENGSVAYMFQRQGTIAVSTSAVDEETLMMIILDAGAEDMETDDDMFQVTTSPEAMDDVRAAIEKEEIAIESAVVEKVPQTYIAVEGNQAKQVIRLMEALDDHDDVQQVWSNFDIDDDMFDDE
ncbi:MAG: YebC/PmpR family DNA-binding transcriptional regulator [Candidatus Electryoneaceae bacterium]|nr:YebC/PmpR family DNA-binding transcriptional regulator [Candidatus Electryoneaceae bacterium]